MNLSDITPATNQLNEAPYNVGASAKDSLLGMLGSSQARGNKEAGQKANEWFKEFKQYIGRVLGSGKKLVPSDYLISFLQSKNIDTSKLGITSQEINPKEAQNLIMQAARQSFIMNNQQTQTDNSQVPAGQENNKQAPQKQVPNTSNNVDTLVSAVKQLSDQELELFLSKL